MSDFKGLKMRVSAGIGPAMATKLGAVPVPSDGPQIFEFASKGIVDGLFLNFGAVNAFKVARYVPYATIIPEKLGNQTWGVIMNMKKWDSLSAADRKAIDSVTGEKLSRSGGKAWDFGEKRGRAKWEKLGNKAVTASPSFEAEIKQRLMFAEAGWIKAAAKRGVDGKAALAYYRSQLSAK